MAIRYCILFLIFTFSALPVLFLGIRKPVKKHEEELSAIKPFLWLMLLGAIYEVIFTGFFRIPTGYWFTAYAFLEFFALWYFFKYLFKKSYTYFLNASLFFLMICFGIALYFWQYSLHEKIEAYLSIPICIFVFTSSFLWFRQLFEKKEPIPLLSNSAFYFISGLVIYFAGGTFVSLLIYEIKILTGFFEKYWVVYVFVALLMRIMMTIGVWVGTERKP